MKLSKVKINEKMEKQNISTFSELSNKLGITKNQMSVMLSDNYTPIKKRVEQLCQLLDVNITEIIDVNLNTCPVNISENDVTAIELFAGAGGLALGLEQAGIKTVKHVEIDPYCCETLKKNRPFWNIECNDIKNIDFTNYKNKIDIVTGGFPCQAFSYAGKKLGFSDVRGTLFYEFARCVKEVKPKIFMAENVRGLISHDNGRTLSTIIDVFSDLEYDVQYKVLNSAFFGVGQKRERIVIIGIDKNLDIEFNYPSPSNRMTTLKEALKNCPKSDGVEYSESKKEVLRLIPPGGCWTDLPTDIAKSYMGKSFFSGGGRRGMARRISWKEPCLTLTCSPSQKQTERCHPDETRPFTVREYARIQSFPDTWEFCGSLTNQYKQIGNAVPVELARRIGIQLKECIMLYRNNKRKT